MPIRGYSAAGTAVSLLALVVAAGCGPRPETRSVPVRDDSVQVGYGTQRRANVTGSIASVDQREIDRRNVRDVVDLLEHIPSLRVERSAHEFTVHVRNATGEPLIVIDGQPLRGATYVLSALRPSDIERIDVLQDAAAAAYGLSGGNGVIIVRTRLRQ